MKQFRIKEHGRYVWVQPFGKRVQQYALSNSFLKYVKNQSYFENLMRVISQHIDEIDLVLKVTKKKTILTLYLEDYQLPLADDIKEALLYSFPDDIEQIYLEKNKLRIIDIFYEDPTQF